MDIFRFSADMLPKLGLLFSGYYVKGGGDSIRGSPVARKIGFQKNLHFKKIFWSPDSVFFILGFFEAFFDFMSFFDAYQAS